MTIDMYIADLCRVLLFFIVGFGLFLFKYQDKSIKYFVWLMISHFVCQLPAHQIVLLMGENARYYKLVGIVYIFLEYLFFLSLLKFKIYRKFISIIFGVGTIATTIHYLDSFSNINNLSVSMLLNNALILLSCFVYFIYMMKNISTKPLLRQWKFIIVTGFFTYTLGSFGAQITTSYAIYLGIGHRDMYIMRTLIYALELCFFYWGLWVYRSEVISTKNFELGNERV